MRLTLSTDRPTTDPCQVIKDDLLQYMQVSDDS